VRFLDKDVKIRQLQERNNALEKINNDNRKVIEQLLTPPKETDCEVRKIPKSVWEKQGLMYPGNLKNMWVNYMTEDFYLIVPKPEAARKRAEQINNLDSGT